MHRGAEFAALPGVKEEKNEQSSSWSLIKARKLRLPLLMRKQKTWKKSFQTTQKLNKRYVMHTRLIPLQE
jgi:hypothetical protein